MNRYLRMFFYAFTLVLLFAGQSLATEKVSFIVLPFDVQGPQGFAYLERSIPQTLTTRLFWQGRVEPVAKGLSTDQAVPKSPEQAEKARQSYGADYVVWGSVVVIGQDCTLEVHVLSAEGRTWRQSEEAQANQLMTAIRRLSDNVNREVFGRLPEGVTTTSTPAEGAQKQLNPNMVVNEATNKGVYLNPQFRYASSAAANNSSLRSQTLPFSTIGMEVCDSNGDGKTEVFLLTDTSLLAYRFENGRLMPLGEHKFPKNIDTLSVRSLPQSNGGALLVVSGVHKDGKANSTILQFDGKTFSTEVKNVRHFLSVAKLPPDYLPTLVGQQSDAKKIVSPGVHEMMKSGNEVVQGQRIALPNEATVWGFSFLSGGFDQQGSDKVIVLSPSENLRTYTIKGSRLAETAEVFSGSAVGLEQSSSMPGLGKDTMAINDMFYIPIRMINVDFDNDGQHEILVNKPISTASNIFHRYRFFPQSEIHSLFWDGIGLNLQWKTNRIKGSVADFVVADANNDGIADLVVCVNTHPGAVGVAQRKTIVVIYPLDLNATSETPMPDLEQ